MAKKRKKAEEEQQRQSRKEILIARKQERQRRQVMLAVLGIAILLGIVLLVGIVNEVFVKPGLPVAAVSDSEITLRDWQDRVQLQRAQLIIGLEDLAETFGQDIGQVQQFAGQQISLLEDPQTLGQLVLDQMVDEQLVLKAAAERGINVTDADVQEEIEASFNYFGGDSPTPFPTPTETTMPTPSLTPIPTQVITEVVPTNTPPPTVMLPTGTPLPTATPVTQDSFQESYSETIQQFDELGVNEDEFREIVRAQLYQDLLADSLAEEAELPDEAEHASLLYMSFTDEEEANQALSNVDEIGFLAAWNTLRSQALDADTENTGVASEILWRTRDDLENMISFELAEMAFDLAIEEPSELIVVPAMTEDGQDQYYIIMVTGREIRPLSDSAMQNAKSSLLTSWLDGQRLGNVETFERWRASVPRRPILDRRFLQPPTPGPPTPTIVLPAIDQTPAS